MGDSSLKISYEFPPNSLVPQLSAPLHSRRAQARFQAAAERVKALAAKPSDEQLLKLYSLFKQGTVGDCNTAQPGMFDFAGKAKWAAWNARKGLAQGEAKKEYVAFVEELEGKK